MPWSRPPSPLRAAAALAVAVIGCSTLLVASSPASAADPDFAMQVSRSWEGDTLIGTLPECGPRNANGRGKGNRATWQVQSTLAQDAVVGVGTEWVVRGRVTGLTANNGNNGPDPLRLRLVVAGAAASVGIVGVGHPGPGEVLMGGDGFTGSVTKVDDYTWEFDMNSNPGVAQAGDGVSALVDVTLRATAEGPVTLPRMVVSGYDETPKAGSFSCDFPVGFAWTVDDPDPPTSGKDHARVDATYGAATVDDRSGGTRSTRIPVLANDDDPEVAGGPGLPGQVRVRDWQPQSVLGGTVSCGTQAQKGTGAFASMSQGPCVYAPPKDTAFGANDSFGYLLRSVSGEERFVTVTVDLVDNTAPVGAKQQFATTVNTPEVFQLQPSDAQGDAVTCFSEQITADPDGDILLDEDCSFTFAANPSAGDKTFTYRACDLHPTLQNGQMGAIGGSSNTRNGPDLYWQGAPDDLDASTASRCRDAQATVRVLGGIQVPPNAGVDVDTVDAGYSGDGVGPYTVEIPVRANDTDANGVDPGDPAFNGSVAILDGPAEEEGTATVNGADDVVFTPADGFTGPAEFTYRVCEDPLQQNPPLVDDPNTLVNEGLGYCGVGTVRVFVVGNSPPTAVDDEALVGAQHQVLDKDVSANDSEPEGEPLVCTAGPLPATPAGLVESATIDEGCFVDLTPAAGADGVATLPYEVCDEHALITPTSPAAPYGADGRDPGDVAPRCSTADLVVTIVPAAQMPADQDDGDPDPTCVADAASTPGQAVTVDVLANDSDEDAEGGPGPLTVGSAGIEGQEEVSAEGGSVAPTGDGSAVTYSPPAGFIGTDTFLYAAQDSAGQACNGEVEVTVTAAAPGAAVVNGSVAARGVDRAAGGGGSLPVTGAPVGPREVLLALGLVLLGLGLTRSGRRSG